MPHPAREYAETHYIYGNARRAANVYCERYLRLIHVLNSYMEGVISGAPHRDGGSEFDSEEVVNVALEEPSTSVCRISIRYGVWKSAVHQTLKKYVLHPYRNVCKCVRPLSILDK